MDIFLINGAKRSGKDTAADMIQNELIRQYGFSRVIQIKAAHPLFNSIPVLFGIDMFVWADMYTNHKETRVDSLGGMSPREAMIWLSEDVMKPKFGKDHFGKALGRLINRAKFNDRADAVIVSDCGFVIEQQAALGLVYSESDDDPNDDVFLIRTLRPGTSFDGDSREYIEPEDLGLFRDRYNELNNDSNDLSVLSEEVGKMLNHLSGI